MAQSNTPTIDVMNITIASFEGRKFYGHTIDKFGGDTRNALPEMKYHTSWDWLMPVVEKIEAMGHKTIIGGGDHWGNYCNIMFNLLTPDGDTKALGQGKTKIEAVYIAVCDFIHWHNNKPTTNDKR